METYTPCPKNKKKTKNKKQKKAKKQKNKKNKQTKRYYVTLPDHLSFVLIHTILY